MINLDIGTQKPQGKAFAINIAIRNASGIVTQYKYFEADTAAELSDIYERNSNSPKKNKRHEQQEVN